MLSQNTIHSVLNKINSFFLKRNLSSNKELDINPWWVTGYTDGEGNFTIKTIVAKSTKIGYTVRLIYQVSVHPSDIEVLYRLKSFFNNVGDIIITKHYVAYRITKLSDILNEVVPHFNAYPLQSTKLISYSLCEAVAIFMKDNEHLTLEGYIVLQSSIKKRFRCHYF